MLYLPVPIPGWLYAIGFLVVSFIAMKRAKDNIGHDAHLGGAIIGLLIAAGLYPRAVSYNWKVFLLVLGFSALLLIHLWLNPLFLPAAAAFDRRFRLRAPRSKESRHKQEALEVDDILDKISRSGTDSLTAEEKTVLESASGKLRRRAESKKPESGLTI